MLGFGHSACCERRYSIGFISLLLSIYLGAQLVMNEGWSGRNWFDDGSNSDIGSGLDDPPGFTLRTCFVTSLITMVSLLWFPSSKVNYLELS